MDAQILEPYEKEFFDLKDKEKKKADEQDLDLESDVHAVFALDATPTPKMMKTLKVPGPREDVDEDYMVEEVAWWDEKLGEISEEFRMVTTHNAGNVISKLMSTRSKVNERISDYARRLAKKNAMYKMSLTQKEILLSGGDKKLAKTTIESQAKVLMANDYSILEMLQAQINYFDGTAKTLDHYFYSMKYFKAMVEILSNTNPR